MYVVTQGRNIRRQPLKRLPDIGQIDRASAVFAHGAPPKPRIYSCWLEDYHYAPTPGRLLPAVGG